MPISAIAEEINGSSAAYKVGSLQEIRARIKGRANASSSTIFRETYAFHYGGRSEIQFNIAYESGGPTFRYGIAFSLESSRSLPDISVLFPKVERFNEYVRLHADDLGSVRMWHWQKKVIRSTDYPVSPIPSERLVNKTFIFVGRHCEPESIDVHEILTVFDALLPMYVFTESGEESFLSTTAREGLNFIPGYRPRPDSTTASIPERIANVTLRHNMIQLRLHEQLALAHGELNVSSECTTSSGTRVDTVVRKDGGYVYYEIKTGLTARSCIRQALPQLLEYSLWPGSVRAMELVVVGEPELDSEAALYMTTLTKEFGLPLRYERVSP